MRCGQTVLIGCEKTWILRADADKLSSSGPQNARNIKSRSAPPGRIGFLAHWIGKGYPVLPSTCATIGSSRCGVAPVGASRPPPIPAAIADCPLPHHFRHFLDPVEGERGHGQRPHGDGHELHRIVVGRHPVGVQGAAALAPMDDGPFAAFADPHHDRLHVAAAVGGPVARFDVHVQTGQAVGTMVPVPASGAFGHDQPSANLAGERFRACVGLVIPFFERSSFVFPVQGGLPPGRILIEDPAGGLYGMFLLVQPPGYTTDTPSNAICMPFIQTTPFSMGSSPI